MALKVADLVVILRGEHAGAMASLRLVDQGLAALGLAAVGAAALLVKMGVDAQTQLSIVAGLTGASAAQMKFYTASLEAMGANLGYTLADAAKGLYYVTSAGFTGRDAITVLNEAMLHAAASGSDLKATADGLTSAMNAYHASAAQATYYSDLFTTAVTYGKQTTEDFANNVSKAALMAAAAHVPFIQLAAAEAALTEKGESSARAFTELSFLMSKISVPSAKSMGDAVAALGGHLDLTKYASADLMGKLLILKNQTGLTTDEFLKLIGGTRSARGALGLLADGGKAYSEILKKMGNDSGTTAAAFDVHTHTMQYAFDRVKAAVSNAGYELVKMATPTVTAFLSKVSDAASHLPDLFKKVGDGAAYIAAQFKAMNPVALGAAIGVASGAFVALAVAAGSAAVAVIGATWPILAIIAGVGLLATGLIYAYQNWGWFRAGVNIARDAAVLFWQRLQQIAAFFGGWIDLIKRVYTQLAHDLAPAMSNVSAEASKLHNWFDTKLLPVLHTLSSWINANVVPAWRGFADVMRGQVMQAIIGIVSYIATVTLPILKELAKSVLPVVGGAFKNLGDTIHAVTTVIGTIIGAISSAIVWIHNLQGALNSVHVPAGIGGVASFLGNLPHFASGGVAPGGPILAGENGAELLVPPAGTQIFNADQTAAILGTGHGSSGGGGYRTANIYVMLDREVLARSLQQPIVDGIRLATGMKR